MEIYQKKYGDEELNLFVLATVFSGLSSLHHLVQNYNYSGNVTVDVLKQSVVIYAASANNLLYMDLCNGCGRTYNFSTIKKWLRGEKGVHAMSSVAMINNKLRPEEIITVFIDECYDAEGSIIQTGCTSVAYFSAKQFLQLWSGMSILKTTIIILVLTITAWLFSKDAQRLVIGPIERMTDMVSENILIDGIANFSLCCNNIFQTLFLGLVWSGGNILN